jgi:hypothetical protein
MVVVPSVVGVVGVHRKVVVVPSGDVAVNCAKVITVVAGYRAGMVGRTVSMRVKAVRAAVSPGAAVRTVLVLITILCEVAQLATDIAACSGRFISRAGEADMPGHAAHVTEEGRRRGCRRSLAALLRTSGVRSIIGSSPLSSDTCPRGADCRGGGG